MTRESGGDGGGGDDCGECGDDSDTVAPYAANVLILNSRFPIPEPRFLYSGHCMNILLFGKNGQLGRALQQALAPRGGVTPVDIDSAEYCGDLCNPAGVADTVRLVKPDVIINSAAYTDVAGAELAPTLAMQINADGVARLATLTKQHDALLVHFSTDYVFDGSGERPWHESDKPAPLNAYGQSKWAGEQAIMASGCRYLILRTSWLHSPWRDNFLKTMLRLAHERDALTVVSDQIGAPTSASLLAAVTLQAINKVLAHPELGGLYHVAARGAVSWYDYAGFVLQEAPRLGFIASQPTLMAVTSHDYPGTVARPLNSRLDVQHFERTFDLQLPDWRSGVTDTLLALSQDAL